VAHLRNVNGNTSPENSGITDYLRKSKDSTELLEVHLVVYQFLRDVVHKRNSGNADALARHHEIRHCGRLSLLNKAT
jgi:hypothetical protein